MTLSDRDLWRAIAEGELVFSPALAAEQIGPATVDLRLGNTFLLFRPGRYLEIDPKIGLPLDYMDSYVLDGENPFILHSHYFALGSTLEYVGIGRGIRGQLAGKSTLARMGLIVHTAGFLDPGYEGAPTLELSNLGPLPVRLYPGMYICQLEVAQLTSPAEHSYRERKRSLYCGDRVPTPARTKNLFPPTS